MKRNLFTRSTFLMLTVLVASAWLWSCTNKPDESGGVTAPPDDGGGNPGGGNNFIESRGVYTIQGKYTNEANNPVFTINPDSISPEISFSGAFAKPAVDSPDEVDVVIRNLSITDSLEFFVIDSLNVAERREEGIWIEDVEFSLFPFERLDKVAVVLVLDASASLGDDFETVKTFAKNFTSLVFQNSIDSKIGVVVFSTTSETLGLTDDLFLINTFIDNANQGPFTALYDAMLSGINMLNFDDSDGKALVTFTDGVNNAGRVTDPDSVITALKNAGDIKSFTIGLKGKGNLNPLILARLAVNGTFAIAESTTILGETFSSISATVSQVYTITYRRNDNPVPENSPYDIRFTIYARSVEPPGSPAFLPGSF